LREKGRKSRLACLAEEVSKEEYEKQPWEEEGFSSRGERISDQVYMYGGKEKMCRTEGGDYGG